MGDEGYERNPTADELAAMAEVVREAVAAGAAGFASSSAQTHQGDGGRPVPSRLADIHEMEALVTPLRELGRGVGAFTPGERVTHPEVYDMQKRIGRPFTWTAMLTRRGSTFAQDMAAYSAEQRAAGVDVWPQVTCRPLTFQMNLKDPFTFNMRPAFKALMDTSMEERLAAYNDPAWRERAQYELEHESMAVPRWGEMTIEEARDQSLVGRSIADVAAERGLEPLDAMIEISVTEDLEPRFRSTLANDDFDTIGDLLQQDGVLMGLSDAGAHVSQLCDACMPTDLLGNWVREREVLTLEHAVHKLTGEPAGVYGFDGRGVLAAGNHADIAVFDPDTISPGPVRRIRDFPADGERLVADQPGGMRHILVNGTPIRVDGQSDADGLGAKPGTILRG
jgi:N-acyl-D-aspartate/D-glutamate deacylase